MIPTSLMNLHAFDGFICKSLLLGILLMVSGCQHLGNDARPPLKRLAPAVVKGHGKEGYCKPATYLGYHETTWQDASCFGAVCRANCVAGCPQCSEKELPVVEATTIETTIPQHGSDPMILPQGADQYMLSNEPTPSVETSEFESYLKSSSPSAK